MDIGMQGRKGGATAIATNINTTLLGELRAPIGTFRPSAGTKCGYPAL